MKERKASTVFISHSTHDKPFASLVSEAVRNSNLTPWIDSERILVGDDILESIGQGLTTTDLVIFIVSKASLNSSWVRRELAYANSREIRTKEVSILPFIVDETPIEKLPWYLAATNFRRVTPDLDGAEDVAASARSVLERRFLSYGPIDPDHQPFSRDPQVDILIENIGPGDWDKAEMAAIKILRQSDSVGNNKLFEAILKYQDCKDDGDLLWGALQTVESCVALAPWLIDRIQLWCMAEHPNYSVRSSAASIGMTLANAFPDRAPVDILMRLSVFNEDWYVQAPANAALKALIRVSPAILQIYLQRLGSDDPQERVHAARTIWEISEQEPELLKARGLRKFLRQLEAFGDQDAAGYVRVAWRRARNAKAHRRYRYRL